LSHFKKVFSPGLVELADEISSFGDYMKAAVCKINKARLPALSLQEEFVGVVARASCRVYRDIEGQPLQGASRRGRMAVVLDMASSSTPMTIKAPIYLHSQCGSNHSRNRRKCLYMKLHLTN
jgi:hypothetical protein